MAERTTIYVEYPNGLGGPVDATFVEPDKAVFENDPMTCLVADSERELRKLPDYQDLVKLRKIGRHKYQFVKVVKRARYRRFQYLLSANPEKEMKAIKPLLSHVEDLGGYWERVFGGVLSFWLPRGCKYDPTDDLNRYLGLRRS